MKRLMLSATLALLASTALHAQAQEPRNGIDLRRDSTLGLSRGTLVPTPEMWFYEQERSRYEDPKSAVRRKAENRAEQREHRLASLKWFGLSNSRPAASSTPLMGTYSPTWISNSHDPYRWRGTQSTIIVTPGVNVVR